MAQGKKGGRKQGTRNLSTQWRQKGTGRYLTAKQAKEQGIDVKNNPSWEKGKVNQHFQFFTDKQVKEFQNATKRHNRKVDKYQSSDYAEFLRNATNSGKSFYTEKQSMSIQDITDRKYLRHRIDKMERASKQFETQLEYRIDIIKENYVKGLITQYDDTTLNRLIQERINNMSVKEYVTMFKNGIPDFARIEYIYVSEDEEEETVDQILKKYDKLLKYWKDKDLITDEEIKKYKGKKAEGKNDLNINRKELIQEDTGQLKFKLD